MTTHRTKCHLQPPDKQVVLTCPYYSAELVQTWDSLSKKETTTALKPFIMFTEPRRAERAPTVQWVAVLADLRPPFIAATIRIPFILSAVSQLLPEQGYFSLTLALTSNLSALVLLGQSLQGRAQRDKCKGQRYGHNQETEAASLTLPQPPHTSPIFFFEMFQLRSEILLFCYSTQSFTKKLAPTLPITAWSEC